MTAEDAPPAATTDARWTTLRAALARAVRRQCPGWLRDQADDLAQSAVLKVMAVLAREDARPLSSFYLHRVAHSALVDEIRRHQRRREVSLDAGLDALDAAQPVEPRAIGTPEDGATLHELGVAIRECLLAMSSDRRQAVMLHLQGHAVADVARRLGWSPKRADNLVYRGLADLRGCLIGKGHTP